MPRYRLNPDTVAYVERLIAARHYALLTKPDERAGVRDSGA